MLGDTTVYAADYARAGFRQIHTGTSERDVVHLVGQPIGETWVYGRTECDTIYLRNGMVASHVSKGCSEDGIGLGIDRSDVGRILGPPVERVLLYSESQNDSHYGMRVIHLRDQRVARVVTGFYID